MEELLREIQLNNNRKPKKNRLLRKVGKLALLWLVTGSVALGGTALVRATIAWYTANKDTYGDYTQTKIDASPNLIVSKSAADIGTMSLEGSWYAEFKDSERILEPAHHKIGADYPVGLEYNTNPKFVSSNTGLKSGTTDLTFEAVPVYAEGDPKRYYYDYTVYLAATEKEMTVEHLNVMISLAMNVEGEAVKDYLQALTTDFYLDGVYCGTLNVVGVDWSDSTTAKTTLDLVTSGSNLTIPHNKEGYLTLTMRSYFDGALLKSTGQTYVYSYNLLTSAYTLTTEISALQEGETAATTTSE